MAADPKKPPTFMVGAGIGAGVGLAMVFGRNIDSLALRTLLGAGIGLVLGLVCVAVYGVVTKKR